MLVFCFGAKTKLCKTIYIRKGYIDSYSDLNKRLQIGPSFFQNGPCSHRKMTNIYIIYQLNDNSLR